jgi:hypothetical protein
MYVIGLKPFIASSEAMRCLWGRPMLAKELNRHPHRVAVLLCDSAGGFGLFDHGENFGLGPTRQTAKFYRFRDRAIGYTPPVGRYADLENDRSLSGGQQWVDTCSI